MRNWVSLWLAGGTLGRGEHRMARIPSYSISREAWYAVFVFFLFMVLHNSDKFLISPLLPSIKDEFTLSYTQLGAIQTGAAVVAVIFMPLWGYLFDKYARPHLAALASAIWGGTTVFSTFSRNFVELAFTRALTGIDNEATSGIVSFIGDHFPPEKRSTAFGILNTSVAIGALLGTIIGTIMGSTLGWRSAFMITGVPGLLLAVLIVATLRDKPRGSTEPELLAVKDKLKDTFRKESLIEVLRRKSMIFLFTQGFFGVFPWQIITYWLFAYMTYERGFDPDSQLFIMLVAIAAMVAGNVVAGITSDWAFRKTLKGRAIFAGISVAVGLVFFDLTLLTKGGVELFAVFGALTGFFIPMAGPAVTASLQDIALPEVRSTIQSVQVFVENAGSAFAPLITGYLADIIGLEWGMVVIITITWSICAVVLTAASLTLPKDIMWKRAELAERARKLVSQV
ncbi:MAG: MFS transporter [Candidatus Brockarchaeota archaeon]|nr:MFS transporter [Candidatus Brockarchaeota archaeon]MBO3808390.1 MFS transporter [Candidatus Brockarchaeota archaeon]